MEKIEKKKYIKICLVLLVIAVIICIVLNQKPKENTNDTGNNQSEYIDTSDIEETTVSWEDIVNIDISGFEGNAYVNISYNDIPEFQEKLEAQWAKWEEIRPTLDSVEDKDEIDAYSNWLEELNKVYSANFCEVPADLNNHVNGDTIKITCNNETLRKLNYKFNDGFEYTLTDISKAEDMKQSNTSSDTSESIDDNETDTTNNNAGTVELETENNNLYNVIGDTILINVNDIDTVNLYQNKGENQTLMVVVDNQDDFNSIKEFALTYGTIDYIQLGDVVYEKESNFTEAEEWKGFSIAEE